MEEPPMRRSCSKTWPHNSRHHPRLPVGLQHPGRLRAVLVLALALLLTSAPGVRAEAPALAVALTELELRVGPGDHYPVLAVLPAGAETVLTGLAEDGYVQITSEQVTGWAVADHLDAGHRTDGVRLAMATVDVAMRTEPAPEGQVRQLVPIGGWLIVTGAVVGDYTAASYNGLGGWVESTALEVLDPTTP
jgi:uncharacterized protein YraI